MSQYPALWSTPARHIRAEAPTRPVLYLSSAALAATHRQFQAGFPGLVTYAVKANPLGIVLENLVASGMRAFDVASVPEMKAVRAIHPKAVLHYNNPVRSAPEIAQAVALGVASYSVDALSELAKLRGGGVPEGVEVSARLKLPIAGAAYDFGDKFGAGPEKAATLLSAIKAMGFTPSMTFHPGTQCTDPQAWVGYIRAAAEVARAAGVTLARLNVGGGFPSHRGGAAPNLSAIFATIASATQDDFGPKTPELVCEPGRAMVADAMTLGCQIKAIRDDGSVFLNDGIYGGLAETTVMGMADRIEWRAPDGGLRSGPGVARAVFGPTCDSLDRLPADLDVPGDAREGDYMLVHGMGAYSTSIGTFFNGYGHIDVTTVERTA